jgi:hypothetical protein
MKYVLIFMLITDGVGSFGFTAEFNDKDACEVALEAVQEARRHGLTMGMHYNGSLVGGCYPKGTK